MKYDLTSMRLLRISYNGKNPLLIKDNDILLAQYNSGPYAERLVRLIRPEDDNFNELWEAKNEFDYKEYFCRNVFGNNPTWYTVSDPFGYCELNSRVKDNVCFIVCDSNWNELFGTSNLTGADFPTFRQKVMEEWNLIKNNYVYDAYDHAEDSWSQFMGHGPVSSVDNWLLTYKDPELYGDEAKTYDENWLMYTDEIGRTSIWDFTYLGEGYSIYQVTYRHRICMKEYVEFWVNYSDRQKMKNSNNFIKLGDHHIGGYGTMYSKREAVKIINNTINDIYPDNKLLSNIREDTFCSRPDKKVFVERQYTKDEAASFLLNGDYHRAFVESVMANERVNHSFYLEDDQQMLIDYPELVRAHKRYGIR